MLRADQRVILLGAGICLGFCAELLCHSVAVTENKRKKSYVQRSKQANTLSGKIGLQCRLPLLHYAWGP